MALKTITSYPLIKILNTINRETNKQSHGIEINMVHRPVTMGAIKEVEVNTITVIASMLVRVEIQEAIGKIHTMKIGKSMVDNLIIAKKTDKNMILKKNY